MQELLFERHQLVQAQISVESVVAVEHGNRPRVYHFDDARPGNTKLKLDKTQARTRLPVPKAIFVLRSVYLPGYHVVDGDWIRRRNLALFLQLLHHPVTFVARFKRLDLRKTKCNSADEQLNGSYRTYEKVPWIYSARDDDFEILVQFG